MLAFLLMTPLHPPVTWVEKLYNRAHKRQEYNREMFWDDEETVPLPKSLKGEVGHSAGCNR